MWKKERPPDAVLRDRYLKCNAFEPRIQPRRATLGNAPQAAIPDGEDQKCDGRVLSGGQRIFRRKKCVKISKKVEEISRKKERAAVTFAAQKQERLQEFISSAAERLTKYKGYVSGVVENVQQRVNGLSGKEVRLQSTEQDIQETQRFVGESQDSLSRELEAVLSSLKVEESCLRRKFLDRQKEYKDCMDQLCFRREAEDDNLFSEQQLQFEKLIKAPMDDFLERCNNVKIKAASNLQEEERKLNALVATWDRECLCKKVDQVLQRIGSDDFWKPADITFEISEVADMLKKRQQRFCEWLLRLPSLIDTDIAATTVSTWMDSFKAATAYDTVKDIGVAEGFSRSVCILEESARNQTAFLDKIAVDSDLEDVDASIDEKIKEVKSVLKDRGVVFSSLQKEMELHLLNQREKLNEAAARVWELTCANAKAKEDYNLATKQLAKEFQHESTQVKQKLQNAFLPIKSSLDEKTRALKEWHDRTTLDSLVDEISHQIKDAETELQDIFDGHVLLAKTIRDRMENVGSEWERQLKESLKLDIDITQASVETLSCDALLEHLIHANDSAEDTVPEAQRKEEWESPFMGSSEGQTKVQSIRLSKWTIDEFSTRKGIQGLAAVAISIFNNTITRTNEDYTSLEETLGSTLRCASQSMLTELWHIRDEQLVQIPTEVKDDIKQAEDACQTFLDSLEASIADYTNACEKQIKSAEEGLPEYLQHIKDYEKYLVTAQSPKALDNASKKIQELDYERGFLSKWSASMELTSKTLVETMTEIKERFHSDKLSSSDNIDAIAKEQVAPKVENLFEKAAELRKEQENQLAAFRERVEEQVSRAKAEILETCTRHAAEIEVLKKRVHCLSELQSKLNKRLWKLQEQTSLIRENAKKLKRLLDLSEKRSASQTISPESTSKKGIVLQKEHIGALDLVLAEMDKATQNQAEGLDDLKTSTVEKIAFCLALLKTGFSVLHLLDDVLSEVAEVQDADPPLFVSFVGFNSVQLFDAHEEEVPEEESNIQSLIQDHTDDIRQIGKDFFEAKPDDHIIYRFKDMGSDAEAFDSQSQSLIDLMLSTDSQAQKAQRAKAAKLRNKIIPLLRKLNKVVIHNYASAALDVYSQRMQSALNEKDNRPQSLLNETTDGDIWAAYRISQPSRETKILDDVHQSFMKDLLGNGSLSFIDVIGRMAEKRRKVENHPIADSGMTFQEEPTKHLWPRGHLATFLRSDIIQFSASETAAIERIEDRLWLHIDKHQGAAPSKEIIVFAEILRELLSTIKNLPHE